MRAPPEVVMLPPSTDNGFRWSWSVCQPDAHWAEIYAGGHEDKLRAIRDADTMLAIATRQWEDEQ